MDICDMLYGHLGSSVRYKSQMFHTFHSLIVSVFIYQCLHVPLPFMFHIYLSVCECLSTYSAIPIHSFINIHIYLLIYLFIQFDILFTIHLLNDLFIVHSFR